VLPLLDLDPDQSPLAVHEVGLFVADQLMVDAPPIKIAFGLTVSDIAGGFGNTKIEAVSNDDPLEFEHVNVKL
jgi:hypothetical protein